MSFILRHFRSLGAQADTGTGLGSPPPGRAAALMNSVALRGVAWSFKAIPRPANGWPKAFLGCNEDLTVNESVDNLRSADAFAVASRTSRQKLRRSLGGTYWKISHRLGPLGRSEKLHLPRFLARSVLRRGRSTLLVRFFRSSSRPGPFTGLPCQVAGTFPILRLVAPTEYF